jgi:hypothetical protein
MLMYVFDHIPRGKMKTGLNVLCKDLDKIRQHHDPGAELFAQFGSWMDDTLLHLAVVTRTRTAVSDVWIKRAGWINLGKAADPTSAKVINLGRHWKEAWSRDIRPFVSRKWRGQLALGGWGIPIHISAPERAWQFLDYFEDDLIDNSELFWTSLTTGDGRVHCAYLQLLPGRPRRQLRTLSFPCGVRWTTAP